MAWYSPSHTAANGSLIALLDTYVASNDCWSVYDASAGTNCKVYECIDAAVNCLFYVKVDDNYSSVAIIELWEGWDAVNHVGTGRFRTQIASSYTLRIYKETGTFYISVKDHEWRFVSGTTWKGTFIGRPGSLVDETKNVVLWAGSSTGASYANNIGYSNWGSSGGWCFLFDQNEKATQALFATMWDSNYTFGSLRTMGSDGEVYFPEMTVCPYYAIGFSGSIIGTLSGVGALEFGATASCKFSNGDTLTVGSDTWLVFGGTDGTNRYFTCFKED